MEVLRCDKHALGLVGIRDIGLLFKKCNELGKGNYGEVVEVELLTHCLNLPTMNIGEHYAMKVIPISQDDQENEELTEVISEAYICKRFRDSRVNHNNVPRIHAAFYTCDVFGFVQNVCIVMDKYQCSLHDIIHDKNIVLSDKDKMDITANVAAAIAFLHSNGIIHRDIKLDNFMYGYDGHLKIIDFGISADMTIMHPECELREYAYALCYRPPEIYLGETRYTYSADIWALGCLIFKVWCKVDFVMIPEGKKSRLSMIGSMCKRLDVESLFEWEKARELPVWKRFLKWLSENPVQSTGIKINSHVDSILAGMLKWDPKKRVSATSVTNAAIALAKNMK